MTQYDMESLNRLNAAAEKLDANRMEVYVLPDRASACEKVRELIPKDAVAAVGGSLTLEQCGILDLLRSGSYRFLDRYDENLTAEEKTEIFRKSFFADVYLCSCNAVTDDGMLYNVDGNSNRVAAIAHGPKTVILVVGRNKLVKNLEEAVHRVKTIAAPLNAKRLNSKTPCAKLGHCISLETENSQMTDGCRVPGRMCCNYLVSSLQRIPDRIKVLLINEDLGM